jgi:hypothetical protein
MESRIAWYGIRVPNQNIAACVILHHLQNQISQREAKKAVRFKFLTAVKIQVEVVWVVTPCKVVVGYQRFRGPCCLHLQGEVNTHEISTCSRLCFTDRNVTSTYTHNPSSRRDTERSILAQEQGMRGAIPPLPNTPSWRGAQS